MANLRLLGGSTELDQYQLSPHFHKREFNQEQAPLELDAFEVNPVLIQKLEQLRKTIGNKPIRIASGYRSPEYNKKVGGASRSQHLTGSAADITVEGMTSAELQKAAQKVGFTFTQSYKNKPHVHIDVRGLEPKKKENNPDGEFQLNRLNLFRIDEAEAAEFKPEGKDYDYNTAQESGLNPDVTGHWPSIDPRTGMILKGKNHPTWDLTLQEEKKLGNKIIKKDNRYYSIPKAEAAEKPGLRLFGDRPVTRLLGEKDRGIVSPETEETLEFRPAPPGWKPGAPLTEEERARATVQLITGERPGLIERKLGITPLRLSQHITEAVLLPIWKGWSTFKSSIVSLLKGERPEPLRAEYGFMDLIPEEKKPQAAENIKRALYSSLIPPIGGEVYRRLPEDVKKRLPPASMEGALGLAELAIDLPAIIASAQGWQHLKGQIGKRMGESFVRKMEPVLRPAIGSKGMEAIPKAMETAARRAPVWKFPKAMVAEARVPWARRPARLALPEASIMEFYSGMPIPKFKIGQKIIDMAGKAGIVKGIGSEAGLTIYNVAFPGVKELTKLSEGLIRPVEVAKPPVEAIPTELQPLTKAINKIGGKLQIRKQPDGEFLVVGKDPTGRDVDIKGTKEFVAPLLQEYLAPKIPQELELLLPKPPPEALAGKPEEETFTELSEFFERAGRAEADVAPKLSEEDIVKSQAEFKVLQGESQSALFDAIKALGKIKPYAKGFLKEELAVVPAHLRTLEADAMTADEMAEALSAYGFQFTGDMDLITTIGDEVAMAAKVKIEYQDAKQYLKDLSKRIRVRTKETEKLIKSIGRLLAKGTLTGPAVKRQIRLVTGQTKVSEMVREDIALREVLKKEAQISRMAAVEARKVATVKFKEHAREVKAQAKERKDIREETNELLERIRKVDTSKMSPISAEAIEEVKSILDFTKPTRRTLSRLNETRKYLERNPDAELPDYVYEDLERLEKLDRSEITLEELRSLADAVDHHVALERTTNQIRVGREMKRADEAVTDSVMEMKPVQDIKEAMITSQKGKLVKGKHIGQLLKDTFGIRHDHYDLVIESLAGANSTMDKVLYQGPKEGKIKELAHRQKVFKQFQEDLEEAGFAKFNIKDIGAWLNERIPIRHLDLTRAERMALYRHTLNENNWLHVVEGGFAFKQGKDPYKVFEVTEEDLEAVIKSLDEAERTFAGSPVNKLFERQYDALNEVFRAKNGYNLPKEEFYYKIEVMRTALPKDMEAESILEELKHKWVRVGLKKGMLKARRKSKLPIYLNSIAYDINSSVLNAAAYVGLEIPLSNASKLLYNKAFRAELTRRYGDITWKEIEKGLRDMAGDFQSYSSTEELLLFLKNNLSTAILGINPFVAAKQVLSFPLYSVYVKPDYLIQGFIDHTTHPFETMERHKLYSPEYAERVEGGYSRDVADVFKTGAEKRLYAGRKSIREVIMGGVKLLDLNAVNPGMQGAVLQVLDELKAGKFSPDVQKALNIKESDILGLGPEEKMALAYKFADYTTERTQPMFSPEHRSSLSRGGTIEKLATQFSSFTNQALNLIRRTWREAKRTKDPMMYAKLAKVLFLLLGVNTAGVMMIDNLRSRIWRSKYRKTFGEALLDSVASYFYFIREVERSVVSKVKRGTFLGYDINLPVLGAGNTIGDAVANGFGMLTADTKKERKKHADKFIDNALASVLMLNGLPYYTPKKLIQAVIKPKKKVKKRKLRTLGGRTLRLLK